MNKKQKNQWILALIIVVGVMTLVWILDTLFGLQ